MSLQSFESNITFYARALLKNSKLRVKDLQEWSTGEIKPQDDSEVTVFIPAMNVYATYKKADDKRQAASQPSNPET